MEEELKKLLLGYGADLCGIADLSELTEDEMRVGISIAIALPKELVKTISHGVTIEYYDTYYKINEQLDDIVTKGADFLKKHGYKAFPQTGTNVKEYGVYETKMPHKTVATNAGLGWIGKSALLVTREYGPAVRLSSILTNAPLKCDAPITESKCGDCMKCHDVCPGHAISGKLWKRDGKREDFFDPLACRKAARKIAFEEIHKEITLCGKCFTVCPYTNI